MQEILKTRKDETTVVLAILTFVLTLFAFSITYFGHQINKSVENRNQIRWKIEQASYIRDFWHDMEVNELDSIERIEKLGNAVGEAQVAYLELMKEFDSLYSTGFSIKEIKNNNKIKGLWIGFIGKAHAIRSESNAASIKYENSILIYSGLAEAMGIKGWDEYASHSEKINEWKVQLLTPYNSAIMYVNNIFDTERLESDFEEQISKISYNIAATLVSTGIPTLLAIHRLKNRNI